MNPSCKIPCNMKKFEHQNVANTMENEGSNSEMLQIIANTVEMAASSSKMLQIARKTGRKADPKKHPKMDKQIIPKTIPDPLKYWWFWVLENWCVCPRSVELLTAVGVGHDVEVRTTAADEEYGEEEDMTEEDWDEEHAEGSSSGHVHREFLSLVCNVGSFTFCLGGMAFHIWEHDEHTNVVLQCFALQSPWYRSCSIPCIHHFGELATGMVGSTPIMLGNGPFEMLCISVC